ncbi:MAG: hypoxanthine-guanine phosphoribosyltransferase [Gammaproteobacteria bacterium]|nr:MAG: hypoxanthine-guanine phosphoribosyltransferase [Gammaproteobacteria bacterium]
MPAETPARPDPEHIREVARRAERLYGREEVEAAYERMAEELTGLLAERDPLVVAVMLGGLIPAGQLLPRLRFPLEVDYLHATRYRGATRGGELHWIVQPRRSLAGRTVLLIDDILDEGYTLAALVEACREAGAAEVYSAVLLDKREARKNAFQATVAGLPVADRYVFGCGMDYRGYLRNLPGIYALPPEEEAGEGGGGRG